MKANGTPSPRPAVFESMNVDILRKWNHEHVIRMHTVSVGPLPKNTLRRQELELAILIFNEFEYNFEGPPQHVIEICHTLMKLYRKNFCNGPITYQNEKALLLGKDGHQSSITSVTRWLNWYREDFSTAMASLELKDEFTVKGFPNLPPEFFILSHSLVKKPFIGWKCLSLVDFLIFPSIHWFLTKIIDDSNQWPMANEYFIHLILWFDKMQQRPELEKYRREREGLRFIHVVTKIAPNLDTKQEIDSYHQTKRPTMLITDITCAHLNRKKPKKHLDQIFQKIEKKGIKLTYEPEKSIGPELEWTQLDSNLDPEAGKLNFVRAENKKAQIENVQQIAEHLLQDGDTIVDFCCGGGHLAIVLAYCFPKCKVILVDRKDVSLAHAVQRLKALKITNVEIFHGDLFDFKENFDLALAIHSCGFLTDLVMDIAIKKDAGYVVAPCCFGGMTNNQHIEFPRSTLFKSSEISLDDFFHLTSGADLNTHKKDLFETEDYTIGKRCMGLIDLDRSSYAVDHGYLVKQYTMNPKNCTPKNDVISGIPKSKLNKGKLTKRELPKKSTSPT